MMGEAITKAIAEATTDNGGGAGTENIECSRTQTRWSHPKAAYVQLGGPR